MDIRQLIDTINHFENKQILNEEVGIQSGTGKNASKRGNFDEQELSDILKAFDEQMNEIGGYGDPDYDKIISALDNGDIESAMEEIVSAYSNQDGGEIRSNDYDNYLDDLEAEFKFLVYSDPSGRVSSTRPLVIRSDDKRATFNPTQFDDNGQRDNRVSEGNDQTSIYKTLIKEFGYKLDEEADGANDQFSVNRDLQRQAATKAAAAPAAGAPADNRNIFQKGFDSVANFHKQNTERFNAKQAADAAANSPEGMAAAKAKLTPSQLAWLGNAQPNPEILQRMPAPTAKEKADAAAAAPGLGLKPPKSGGFAASLPPLNGSTPQPVGNQGLKMPNGAMAPVTSVAAAQAALAPEANPEASMGAGSGAAPVAANKPAAAPEDNPEAAMGAGSGAAPVAANKPASAAVATPVAPQTPNTATALPPAAGAEATKIARFKELLGKAKAGSVTPPAATKESVGYFLNKLRFIESRQLNEALTPEEQKEIDGLYAELGQQGSENNPELVALINDYNSLPKSAPAAGAAAPAFNARKDSQQFQDKFAADSKAVADKLRKIADDGLTGPQDVAAVKQMMDQVKQIQADPNFVTMAPELQNTINDAVKKAEPVVAAAPAAAAPAQGNVAGAVGQAGAGQPAGPAGGGWSYVIQGTDQALAHAAGFTDVAKWQAAGSPGKPRTQAQDDQNDLDTSSQPEYEYKEDPLNDRQTDTLNHQMAQNRNGIDPITGQNVSMKDPLTGDYNINPESGKSSITPAAAPAAGNAAASTYKGNAGAQEIQKLNPAIKDVNKIYPGQKFKMPDGSTYTVKPGDTLDKIAKGAKPAEATKMPTAKQQDQIDKAPALVNPLNKVPDKTRPQVPAPAAPVRKELDLDRMKQLSGQPRAPANPGKTVPGGGQISNTPAAESRNASIMNPVGLAPTKESIRNQDDAILERIRSALRF